MTETETKWTERVREWKASGQSAKQFAEGREFKGSTLTYWASELRKRERSGGGREKRAPQLRMARVVAKGSADQEKLVVQVGSARVVVRSGFDAALLRHVVEALRGAS